jgi:hypothetical protein
MQEGKTMFSFLEKHAALLSTGLALALVACSLFLPASASLTGVASLGLILCAAILRRARMHHLAFKQGDIPYTVLKRNVAVDTGIILVAFLLVSAAGREIGAYIGAYVTLGAEVYWPGMSGMLGFLAALVAAFAVGFGGWRLAAWAQARLQAHQPTFSSHHNEHRSQR